MVTQVFLSGTELTLFSPTWRSFPGRFDGGNQVITDGDLMNNTQIGAEPYSDRPAVPYTPNQSWDLQSLHLLFILGVPTGSAIRQLAGESVLV